MAMIDNLGLTKGERRLVRETFTFEDDGVSHDIVAAVFDWLSRAGAAYLEAKRDPSALFPYVPDMAAATEDPGGIILHELVSLLDRLLEDRVEMIRDCAADVQKDPPKLAGDL